TAILQSDPPTIFLEVSNDGGSELVQELFVEYNGAKVPLKNGMALHLAHRAGERLLFTVITADRQPLCSWQPSFVTGWASRQASSSVGGVQPGRNLAFSQNGRSD